MTAMPQLTAESAAPLARLRRFTTLEIGRGVAAMLVVLHHAGSVLAEPRFFGYDAFNSHLGNFNVGIDFFFVLSGFIITWAHWDDIGLAAKAGSFVRKRAVRIYPPYWAVLIPLIIAYLVAPAAGKPEQHDPVNIVLSLLLAPNPQEPVLGVAWTLTYEMMFYALFLGVIVLGRRALLLLPLWAVGIVAVHLRGLVGFPLSFLFSPFNVDFIGGVGAAVLLRNHRMPWPSWAPGWAMAVAALCFGGAMLFWSGSQSDPLVGRLVYGGSSLLFVLGAVEFESRRSLAPPRIALLLGAASYAIYLTHPVVLSAGAQLLRHLRMIVPNAEVGAVLLALFALPFGIAFHWFVERPLVALARRATGGR